MNKMEIIIFALLVLSVVLLLQSDIQPMMLKRQVEEGKTYAFTKEKEYWSQITDFCIQEDSLYVLFGDIGVLNVYDLNGHYQKSFAFYKTKGVASLHSDNQFVYLYDQSKNYYCISSGEIIEYVEYSTYNDYVQKTNSFISKEDQRRINDVVYYMKYASIYRINKDQVNEGIVIRPILFAFFQGIIPLITIGLLIILIFILKLAIRKD